jgi:hypothetical protein
MKTCNKQCQNLQQTMSDPASQSYTITSSCNPSALPFSQGFFTYTWPAAQITRVCMRPIQGQTTYVHD